jgi:hypothetical protein
MVEVQVGSTKYKGGVDQTNQLQVQLELISCPTPFFLMLSKTWPNTAVYLSYKANNLNIRLSESYTVQLLLETQAICWLLTTALHCPIRFFPGALCSFFVIFM